MLSKEDLALHKGLVKLLNDGTFELKAREVPAFGAVYNWALKINEMKCDKCNKKKKGK